MCYMKYSINIKNFQNKTTIKLIFVRIIRRTQVFLRHLVIYICLKFLIIY